MSEAKEIAKAYFDRAMAQDPKLGELFAEDASWWVPESSPLGGTHRGKEAIFAMLERAFALYELETMRVELLQVFGEGDHACVRFEVDARTAKGLDWKGEYVAVFEVRDDKIRSVREYFDTKRLVEVVFA